MRNELHLKLRSGELVPGVIYYLPGIPDKHIYIDENGKQTITRPRMEIGIPRLTIDVTYLHAPQAISPISEGYRFYYASLYSSRYRAIPGTVNFQGTELLPNIPHTGADAEKHFIFPMEVVNRIEEMENIKPRVLKNQRDGDLKLFVRACLNSFIKKNGDYPIDDESLARFSVEESIQGYSEISDSGGTFDSRRIGYEGRSFTWKNFQRNFKELRVDMQFTDINGH
jgi:hypothetical protein